MKISIDKNFTTLAQVEAVKEKAKEFKARYTDGDIRWNFEEQTEYNVNGEILKCDVSVFPTSFLSEECNYEITLVIDGFIDFKKVHFFMDENLKVQHGSTTYRMYTE